MVLRWAALLCAMLPLSACVLPIGPDFQDPLASPNYSPFFIDSDPEFGTQETATPAMSVTFHARISDPNVGDNLTVRWIVDYPPFTADTRPQPDDLVMADQTGKPLDKDVSFTPNCVQNTLAKIPVHHIKVVVSDRGFVTVQDPTDLTSIPAGGFEIVGDWSLALECP
jgi:hypothetical protein